MGRPAVQIDYPGGKFVVALGADDNYCDRCGSHLKDDIPLILTDSSDGEYGGLSICRPCIERMWAEVVDLQQKHMPGEPDVLISATRD